MSRQTKIEAVVFVLLVSLGVGLRLGLQDIPNFAPVAGIALFAGYYFRSWMVAAAVPLTVMLLSDFYVGFYHPGVMATVYGMLAAPILLRSAVRRIEFSKAPQGSWGMTAARNLAPLAGLVGCSLAASVAFFLATNFAHWLAFDMYDRTPAGLLHCYVQGLPFFRYTLVSDLLFSLVFFGSYALALQLGQARQAEPEMAMEAK